MRSGPPLLLGSASPRRRDLLASIGLPHEVEPAGVDEPAPGELPPRELVVRSARLKARTVADRRPGRLVLGADTIVVLGDPAGAGEVLVKPGGAEEAARMLSRLSGRRHVVLTAVVLARSGEAEREEALRVSATEVHFARLDPGFVGRYVATGEPLDKAGAYGAQGFMGTRVRRVSGSWSNVVGLPLEVLDELFAELGEDLAAWQDW
jgi:septum formation protein